MVDQLVPQEGELPQFTVLQVLEEEPQLVVRVEAEAAVLSLDNL